MYEKDSTDYIEVTTNNFLISSIAGLSNDNTNISSILDDRESDSTKYLHANENNRKLYPQRNNRSRLNYRDLERGMYEEIRQSMWTHGGSAFMIKNNDRFRNDGEHEIIDLSMDDDDDEEEKSTNDTDQMHRRLWCICQKPWDHSKLMLRCDLCANWYHGDCVGVSTEEAKVLDIDDGQFICSPCRGIPYSTTKRAKSSQESIPIKRKRLEETSSVRTNEILSNNMLYDQSTKKPISTGTLSSDSVAKSKTRCIVQDCPNSIKSDWIYCSSACIRRHINEILQDIQQSKGMDDVDIPTRDDISLYESRSNKLLEKNSIPKIEDLCTWINQHPSYQLIKSSSRKSIPSTTQQSKDLTRSFSHTTKSKPSSTSVSVNPKANIKSMTNKKNLIALGRPTSKTTSNLNSTADLRSKVPSALYDKISIRLVKNGEEHISKQDIQMRVNQIEQEMFRVYGKVDNTYKNKFRSLLANISNTNNNFFYKQILSSELTAKQIVGMKPDDMLPPEEREKRKDEFEKEIQMIIKSEEEKAVEMARRMRTKVTKQGLVDNDAHYSSLIDNLKEQNSAGQEIIQSKENERLEMNSRIDQPMATIESNHQTESLPPTSLKKSAPPPPPIVEEPNPTISTADLDNDYIEPESPTGIDALIYDDEDNDDYVNISSRSSTSRSPTDNAEDILPYQPVILEDYNPLKAKNETAAISLPTPIAPLLNYWRGVIQPPDTKLPCQSVHIYGESDHLISDIPEQLLILGRLRLSDLWDYIRNSLTVRDVLILTLTSSSLNITDNELFLLYVDTMHKSGRAAVISKCTNSALIRDIYILAADTKECPSSVLSSLSLPMTFESKQLFLVIIGSGKRPIKPTIRTNDNQSLNNLTYKPVALQESSITRDPRLQKNKDPRLNRSLKTTENIILPTQQTAATKQTTMSYSNEDLLKLISDSLQRIRQASTADAIRSIVASTTEILETHKRHDLITRFNDNIRLVMAEWQTLRGNTSIAMPTNIIGDNLIEENMDVDDDHDEKQKKQQITSSGSHSVRELNDVDYRFVDQELDHHLMKANQVTSERKPRRKSRFSDLLPTDYDRFKRSKIAVEKVFSKGKEVKSAPENTALRINKTKIASPEYIDKHHNASKFRTMIYSTEPAINIQNKIISNSSRFSLPPDSHRVHRSNMNNNWTKSMVSTNPIRSTTTFNLVTQPETKKRSSTSSNEWRSRSSSSNYYMTHYHDFDQPQE